MRPFTSNSHLFLPMVLKSPLTAQLADLPLAIAAVPA
jgi:hypothetical protein